MAFVISRVGPSVPRTVASFPAGAFHTPRALSVRAHTPAATAEGPIPNVSGKFAAAWAW